MTGTQWGGVARVRGVATAEECAWLAGWLAGELDAGRGRRGDANPDFDGRAIAYSNIADEAAATLVDRLRRHLALIGQSIFGWPVLYPSFSDLVRWSAGAELGWHADSDFFPERAVIGVLALNDGFQGGCTEIEEGEGGAVQAVRLAAGEAALWRASWRHRVCAVDDGTRYTLAAWSTGDRGFVEYR